MNPGNFGFDALRYNTSATYVGLLTQLKDPSVYVTTEPATALVKGKDSTDLVHLLAQVPVKIWEPCIKKQMQVSIR